MFGSFSVHLDGWDVDYGAELRVEPLEVVDDDAYLDLDVEQPSAAWRPIGARGAVARDVLFVDGVRRIDARLLVRSGDIGCFGAFGSYGVGVVATSPIGIARFDETVVVRHLAFGSGQLPEWPVRVGPALDYLPLSGADVGPDGPLMALQAAMRRAEAVLAAAMAVPRTVHDQGPLVVADGPLHAESTERIAHAGDLVGLVKRLYRLYLPDSHRPVLADLGVGERTPVFLIGRSPARTRFSWFVRLARPGPGESDLGGLVRLETRAAVGSTRACGLADETASRLPAFAPSRARDPRAPQNLLPIGALEQHLRHRLGDPSLIRRKITSLLV